MFYISWSFLTGLSHRIVASQAEIYLLYLDYPFTGLPTPWHEIYIKRTCTEPSIIDTGIDRNTDEY